MRKLLWTYIKEMTDGDQFTVTNVDMRLNGLYCVKIGGGDNMQITLSKKTNSNIPSTTVATIGKEGIAAVSSGCAEFWFNSIADMNVEANAIDGGLLFGAGHLVIECWSNE